MIGCQTFFCRLRGVHFRLFDQTHWETGTQNKFWISTVFPFVYLHFRLCTCVFVHVYLLLFYYVYLPSERSPLYIIWSHNVRRTYWATGTQYIWIKLQLHCFSIFFIFYISTIALASSSQEFQALPWSFNARIRFSSKPRGATYIKPPRDDDDII